MTSKQLEPSGFVKLSIVRDTDPLSDRPGDPLITDHIAINTGELSLIRRYRTNLDQHLKHEWVRGRLVPAGLSITVREKDITTEMKQHFSWRLAEPLSDEKVALFVKLYQAVAKNLDPDRIEICGHSYAKGPVDYGRLETSAKQELLERCKCHFSAAEIKELSRFIESQRDGDGVMTLSVRNLYTIEESQTRVNLEYGTSANLLTLLDLKMPKG